MYLRVNGVPIFLKGANLIPFHAVRTQVTPEMMMSVLKSATDGELHALGLARCCSTAMRGPVT
jgi:hypothetical protein